MSLVDDNIPSSKIFQDLSDHFSKLSDADKKKQIDATKGVFEMRIKKGANEGVYTVDLKREGKVTKGPAKPKADVIISMSDDVFHELASGKLNGQKAFMSGKLKVKGNIMMSTKLDGILKSASSKL